jgi:pimeloyl-ACP methyl ester carboxylesterase
MTSLAPGVGLADDYWKNYFSPDEVDEILAKVSHTTIASSGTPIAIRAFLQDGPAPTLMMCHGLLPYGLMLSKFYLAFHRAGFNVVNADLPGFGMSGGPRGGPTIPQMIEMWRDIKTFTQSELGSGPLFMAGAAEDSSTAYYALANDPDMDAMSFHNLLEYGDVENLAFVGSNVKARAMMLGARLGSTLHLDLRYDALKTIPWEDIIDPHVETYKRDPLAIRSYTIEFAATMSKPLPPPVRFEDCRTPAQVIASEKSRLWPLEHNREGYERLGSPIKEFVLMEAAPQWSLRDEFVQEYTENVVRFFRANGATVI